MTWPLTLYRRWAQIAFERPGIARLMVLPPVSMHDIIGIVATRSVHVTTHDREAFFHHEAAQAARAHPSGQVVKKHAKIPFIF
ncbi:MAG: hypothetical protein ING10_08145 [Roseomonas sp.]|nr:hypothetical protein [Roseomonas sp.]